MKKIVVFLCMFLTVFCANAQKQKSLWLKFPSQKFSYPVKKELLGKDGMVILTQLAQGKGADSTVWNAFHYDVNFNLQHQEAFQLPATFECLTTTTDNHGNMYALFRSKKKVKKSIPGCMLQYDIRSHTFVVDYFEHITDDQVVEMKAENGTVAVLQKNKNNAVYLLLYTMGDHYMTQLKIENNKYRITDFIMDTLSAKLAFCLETQERGLSDPVLWICESNYKGELTNYYEVPDTMQCRFADASISQVGYDEYLVCGTFTNRITGQPSYFEDNRFYGVYTLHIKDGKMAEPKYFSLENNTGQLEFRNVVIMPGEIYQHGDQTIFVTETCRPIYSQRTDIYGYWEDYISGYYYMYAYVKAFDLTGNQLWAYKFPYEDFATLYMPRPQLNLSFFQNKILMYYVDGSQLMMQVMDDNLNVLSPLRYTPMMRNTAVEEKDLMLPEFEHWYDNNFVFSSLQLVNRPMISTALEDSETIQHLMKIQYK